MSIKTKFKLFKEDIKKWISFKILNKMDVINIFSFLVDKDILSTDEINGTKYVLNNRLYFIKVQIQTENKPVEVTLNIEKETK